jgi:hypothetical protein
MKKFTLEQLTEGIRNRNLGGESKRLVEKWSRTGLLRGLEGTNKENMSRLLENQAAELLREFNSVSTGGAANTASGDLRGFTNIAFPIVRRVFGGLVANELVSVQPMSLPSGLLFYLDYTYGNAVGGDTSAVDGSSAGNAVYTRGQSIYNNPAGAGIQSGSLAAGGMYDLVGAGFSRVQSGSVTCATVQAVSGSFVKNGLTLTEGTIVSAIGDVSGSTGRFLSYDPQLVAALDDGTVANLSFLAIRTADITSAIPAADMTQVDQIALFAAPGAGAGTPTVWGQDYQAGAVFNLRRHNQRIQGTYNNPDLDNVVAAPLNGNYVMFVVQGPGGVWNQIPGTATVSLSAVVGDTLNVDSAGGVNDASTLVIPSFESNFGTTPAPIIPEIDIKVESIAVTAQTRKLRARWSPELAQDLNAYHSLDAEVELTQILSEQVALEIDREILNDLLTQANGANLYWSRAPGKFVNKTNGNEIGRATVGGNAAPGPAFTGTVREWYETLIETVIDCANTIHRKTLRGSANFMVVSPDVATILEASVYYRPNYSVDGDGQVSSPFNLGAEKVGTLSNRFTVYKDPYFPRNKILVGYKGGSYLETGYVYAPYVPLIVTPTIFAPEDFTPRKGVMTRYGKKMVRSDFYGTITCLDMNII